jgi:hypothetical protein
LPRLLANEVVINVAIVNRHFGNRDAFVKSYATIDAHGGRAILIEFTLTVKLGIPERFF